MDDISEFLLGAQRSAGSTFGRVLGVIGVALAIALTVYLLHCYVREALIRKRVKQRVCQPCGGNIVPAEVMSSARALSETKRLSRKSSRVLPLPPRDDCRLKVRRRGVHPWKQRVPEDAPAPH